MSYFTIWTLFLTLHKGDRNPLCLALTKKTVEVFYEEQPIRGPYCDMDYYTVQRLLKATQRRLDMSSHPYNEVLAKLEPVLIELLAIIPKPLKCITLEELAVQMQE